VVLDETGFSAAKKKIRSNTFPLNSFFIKVFMVRIFRDIIYFNATAIITVRSSWGLLWSNSYQKLQNPLPEFSKSKQETGN
jgi:hypothetical protein